MFRTSAQSAATARLNLHVLLSKNAAAMITTMMMIVMMMTIALI
jgi:hypothetical protein